MQKLLDIDADLLAAQNSYWTAREIAQQPRVWIESRAAIERRRARIEQWLAPKLADDALRIVLSGAGSSAYVGETLAPWLRKKLTRRADAVSTTDLVGHPSLYLAEDVPTLLVSFARSGDSPESVASVEVANRVLSECHHLVVTCNPDGHLAKLASSDDHVLCLTCPSDSNDRSFAMTSSYTSMLVSCAAALAPDPDRLKQAAESARFAVRSLVSRARALAGTGFGRAVVLGAGCLRATAGEASLKCLELTNGRVAAIADTPMGFRHGPKSVVDENTCVILLRSTDPYVARYDLDLLRELRGDGRAAMVVVVGPDGSDPDKTSSVHVTDQQAAFIGFHPDSGTPDDDFWMSLPYMVFCQMFAFFKARSLGVSADNPCPSGEVNRVVKGVTIYPYPD